MAFTEAQQQIIDKVINSSMKDDFAEDRETISEDFDLSVTQDQKDAAYLELATEYADVAGDKAKEEADALANTASATTRVESDNLQIELRESREEFS
jgi:hypothetical protein